MGGPGMTGSGGFFADADAEVERTGDGRPKILQPDGKRIPYTRASGLGDFVADAGFLLAWKMRYLAIGLGRRPDLADMCAVETYTTGFDENPKTKGPSARRLDGIIARALDYMKIDERADRGTVVHAVTETGYDGYVPIAAIGEAASFHLFLALNSIERLGSELFTVNDELRVAGTFDHLFYIPDVGIVIGDTKNGRNSNPIGFGIQFANYANSVLYDQATDQRLSLEDYVASLGYDPADIRRDIALLLSVKENETKPSWVNIEWGYEMAKLAAQVRDARDSTAGKIGQCKDLKHGKGKLAKEAVEQAIIDRLLTAETPEILTNIWRTHKAIWTPAMTNAAAERKAEQ